MKFDRSVLIRIFGYRAAMYHGDTLMLDRWRFLRRHMPRTVEGEAFDVGCGTGAFTLRIAARGYKAVGLSWDKRNQQVAEERASICGLKNVSFPIGDARELDSYQQFAGQFDYVVSLENIEHVRNDKKLIIDLAACLRPGGWLVLSTPNQNYRSITPEDDGPFDHAETGWHVRRGYTEQMLRELSDIAGLRVEDVGTCSGFLSQKITWLMRKFGLAGWVIGFPLRILPPVFDRLIERLTGYPDYSITMVAYKPRF